MIIKRTECTLCEREIIDYPFFISIHVCIDVSCMFLFLLKMVTWMFVQSFRLGKIRNFPCKCTHKAFWHMANFESGNFSLEEINWKYLLFRYKFVQDKEKPLSDCLRCNLFNFKARTPPSHRSCFEYQPLNNLIYLENIYKKK